MNTTYKPYAMGCAFVQFSCKDIPIDIYYEQILIRSIHLLCMLFQRIDTILPEKLIVADIQDTDNCLDNFVNWFYKINWSKDSIKNALLSLKKPVEQLTNSNINIPLHREHFKHLSQYKIQEYTEKYIHMNAYSSIFEHKTTYITFLEEIEDEIRDTRKIISIYSLIGYINAVIHYMEIIFDAHVFLYNHKTKPYLETTRFKETHDISSFENSGLKGGNFTIYEFIYYYILFTTETIFETKQEKYEQSVNALGLSPEGLFTLETIPEEL